MEKPVIRTVTIGIAQPHPITPARIGKAVQQARQAEDAFHEAGYEVQTVRLTSRPVFDDLAEWTAAELVRYANDLQDVVGDLGMDYLSLGPATACRPDFSVDRLAVISDLLMDCPALNCTVQLGSSEEGVRADAAMPAARIVRELADGTENGIGNFRFAALAGVGPGHPFFPASYHDGPDSLTVGTQSAGVVAEAVVGIGLRPTEITGRVREAVVKAASPVVELATRVAGTQRLRFGGIDLSPAPAGSISIGAAFQAIVGQFGAPGTLAVAAALTEALRTTDLPTCGYNGLMLPVLEDEVLAADWAQGRIRMHQLLSYSAVCGTGLDTVPLPGDTPTSEIAALLLDVATLAVRLRKPLSARLFPVPGKRAGDFTSFGSPYLVDLRLP